MQYHNIQRSNQCDEWLDDKTRNPKTGRAIKVDGPLYKQLEKECEPSRHIKPTRSPKPGRTVKADGCDEWLDDKTRNPKTGRAIKVDGPLYKQLEKECEPTQVDTKKHKGKCSSQGSLTLPSIVKPANNEYRIPDSFKLRMEINKSIKGPFRSKFRYKHYGYLIERCEDYRKNDPIPLKIHNTFLTICPYFIYSYSKNYMEPLTREFELDTQDVFEICVALRTVYAMGYKLNSESYRHLYFFLEKQKIKDNFYEIIIDNVSYYVQSRSRMAVVQTRNLISSRKSDEYYIIPKIDDIGFNITNIDSAFFQHHFKHFQTFPTNVKVLETFNIPPIKKTKVTTNERFIRSLTAISQTSYTIDGTRVSIENAKPIDLPEIIDPNIQLETAMLSPANVTRIPQNFYTLQNLTELDLVNISSPLPTLPESFIFKSLRMLTLQNIRSSNIDDFLSRFLKNCNDDMLVELSDIPNVSITECKHAIDLSVSNCETLNFTNFTAHLNNANVRMTISLYMCNNIMFPEILPEIVYDIKINTCGITGIHPSLLRINPSSRIELLYNQNISLSVYERLFALVNTSDNNVPRIEIALREYDEDNRPMEMFKDVGINDPRFTRWVLKLETFIRNNCKLLIDLIPDITTMVTEMVSNEEYLEASLNIMDDATSSCGDRIILSVLYLSIQYKMYTLQYDNDSVELIFETIIRGPYIISILEEIARIKVKTLPFFDEIEVYLAYPIMLREKFKIPIAVKGMLYYTISAVNEADLDYAVVTVQRMLRDTDEIVKFLFTQSLWNKMLFHLYPDEPIEQDTYYRLTKQLMDRYTLEIKID